MSSLYVYYRVDATNRAHRLAQWRALATALAAHRPRRQCRRDDADTWMEIYPDVGADFEPAYRTALAALDADGDWCASRHEEWFIDADDGLPWAPRPSDSDARSSAMPVHCPRGPVMVDVAGLSLTDAERQRLLHPLVGAVILFRRNFQSLTQLRALTAEIHALRSPALIIAVDHEGGRVQRFIDGFIRLPSMRALGTLWGQSPGLARARAEAVGEVLAAELRACGVDLSFTPVLDLDWSRCAVIGNRAFHRDPDIVAELALALQTGLLRGGMAACGKHFPGHGWVEGDSHHVIPRDERSLEALRADDLRPFARLAQAGLAAVMPAHVVYPAVDEQPAGFSPRWLQDILRGELGFAGAIFSDDLCMEGASAAGDITARARAAFAAGCDMALVCNRPALAEQLLAELDHAAPAELASRLAGMAGRGSTADWQAHVASAAFAELRTQVAALSATDLAQPGPAVGEANAQ